jgi:hypothetical protein
MTRPCVLFLFNLTDVAPEPWVNAGYNVLACDTQHPLRVKHVEDNYVTTNAPAGSEELQEVLDLLDWEPVLVISWTPCTDLAVSGAAHFAKKRMMNPHYEEEALELALLATDYDCAYCVENPISRLSSLWRKPDHYYHPYEYGGYCPDGEHPLYPDYIPPKDAYPKKTCWWTGGGFEIPIKFPVTPDDGYSKMHLKLGGKSMKTKNIRSATPRGVALAMYVANRHLIRSL